MSQSIDVVVPDMGSFAEVGVVEVLVKPGDRVELDTPLVTLETEKATMDVPSTTAGIVEAVHVVAGGKISAGGRVGTQRLLHRLPPSQRPRRFRWASPCRIWAALAKSVWSSCWSQ